MKKSAFIAGESRRLGSIWGAVIATGLFGAGVLAAFLLYESKFFSWSSTSVYAPLVAVGMAVVSSGILMMLIAPPRLRNAALALSVAWFGFTAGLLAPPLLLGREAEFQAEQRIAERGADGIEDVDSLIYSMQLQRLDIPEIDASAVAGTGGNSPTPYLAQLDPNNFLVAVGANIGSIDLEDPPSARLDSTATLLHIRTNDAMSDVEVVGVADFTDISPTIQQVRDVQFEANRLLLSNVTIKDGCLRLDVWSIAVDVDPLVLKQGEILWSSSPELCGGRRSIYQSGGRLATLPDGSILVTIGDFRLGPSSVAEESDYQARPVEMTPPNTYGMVMRIDQDGTTEVVSTGHRNAQGLAFDPQHDRIWSTEHGPRGGGELNLIVKGNDYGWPDTTYGVPYGLNLPQGDWEVGRWAGRHVGFTKPLLSWMPSIAPSQVLIYEGPEFAAWNGDLLVATLLDRSIRRLRLVGSERVVVDERIHIGERIRDIIVLQDGRLLLAFDRGGETGGALGVLGVAMPD